jgi:hypothetical protein
MKTYKDKEFDSEYKIIQQYGGGDMIKPGSYDRYVVFRNTPEADFLCIVWPMGLIQVSCNPFKEKKLQDINLGEIAKEVLNTKYLKKFDRYYISLESLKMVYETSQDWVQMQRAIGEGYNGIGFKFSDLEAFYIDCLFHKPADKVKNILDKVLEIDFAADRSEQYKNIKALINFENNTYVFKVTDLDSIKSFVNGAIRGDISNWSPINEKVEKFESDISKKQIEGAKNNITNLLKGGNSIVVKRDKISIFGGLTDSRIKEAMNTNYNQLNPSQKRLLSDIKIPVWELIIRNSGGHPSITNISGLNFLPYNKRLMKIMFNTEKYTDVLKMLAKDLVDNLKEKIDLLNSGEVINYQTGGLEFLGQEANESFDYQLADKNTGIPKSVTRDEFIKAGVDKAMKPDRKSLMTIDTDKKRIIAKFESFNNSKL